MALFRKLQEKLSDMFEVQDSQRRDYPWINAEVIMSRASLPKQLRSNEPVAVRVRGVADHILGTMRDDVWAEDTDRRPFRNKTTGEIDLGWYEPGDSVGARGLEKVFEDTLRGLRGEIRERGDSGKQIKTEAVPGKDLQVTIDVALQARHILGRNRFSHQSASGTGRGDRNAIHQTAIGSHDESR